MTMRAMSNETPLSEWLLNKRRMRGLTQDAVLGPKGRSTISNIERGATPDTAVSDVMLAKIADGLRVRPTEVFAVVNRQVPPWAQDEVYQSGDAGQDDDADALTRIALDLRSTSDQLLELVERRKTGR